MVSIDRPFLLKTFPPILKNYLKGFKNQKTIMSGKTTSQGIKELAGLKTGKKHDRGAPYLLIQHDSGCRRHKVKNPPKYIDKKSAKFYTAYVDYYMC